jgi:hypothetical protein
MIVVRYGRLDYDVNNNDDDDDDDDNNQERERGGRDLNDNDDIQQ